MDIMSMLPFLMSAMGNQGGQNNNNGNNQMAQMMQMMQMMNMLKGGGGSMTDLSALTSMFNQKSTPTPKPGQLNGLLTPEMINILSAIARKDIK